jgi:cytosine/uracil/thiamine/allantoin permease
VGPHRGDARRLGHHDRGRDLRSRPDPAPLPRHDDRAVRDLPLFDDRAGGRFWYSRGWRIPGIASLLLGALATALCLATDVWAGPIAQATGFIDLSVPVGMLVAGSLYAILQRTPLGKEGRP